MDFLELIREVFFFGEMIPFAEYTVYHALIAMLGTALGAAAAVFALWLVWNILKAIYIFFKVLFSAKRKCRRIQCSTCGRTLDKCVCEKNKGKGNVARLMLYSKERRAAKAAKKKAAKETSGK